MSEDAAPASPAPFTIAAPDQQVSIGIAETPAGQRLAIVVTTLLDPAAAKQMAAAFGQAAAAMSATGLVVANGTAVKM